MSRITLRTGDELQLDLVEPDDAEFQIRFDTICLKCGQTVARTTYTADDQNDPGIEERIDQDFMVNLLSAHMHQYVCRQADERDA